MLVNLLSIYMKFLIVLGLTAALAFAQTCKRDDDCQDSNDVCVAGNCQANAPQDGIYSLDQSPREEVPNQLTSQDEEYANEENEQVEEWGDSPTDQEPSGDPVATTDDFQSQRYQWPWLVGMKGTDAKQQIEAEFDWLQVMIVPQGSVVTADYRTDRVRIYVDKKGIVKQTPKTG